MRRILFPAFSFLSSILLVGLAGDVDGTCLQMRMSYSQPYYYPQPSYGQSPGVSNYGGSNSHKATISGSKASSSHQESGASRQPKPYSTLTRTAEEKVQLAEAKLVQGREVENAGKYHHAAAIYRNTIWQYPDTPAAAKARAALDRVDALADQQAAKRSAKLTKGKW